MQLDTKTLREALYHASREEICRACSPEARVESVAYGRGVLVGLVAGLIASGLHFDEAWKACLEQVGSYSLLKACIPLSWPCLEDYQAAKAEKN